MYADVAQLVERNLAKVEVAGSSPVIRSEGLTAFTVEWPRGEAAACKAAYTGSNPVSTSDDLNPESNPAPPARPTTQHDPGRLAQW